MESMGVVMKIISRKIIDTLMRDDSNDIDKCQISQPDINIDFVQSNLECNKALSLDREPVNIHQKTVRDSHPVNGTVSDFNYPDKKIGFITLEATGFSFTGRNREPTKIESID